MDIGAFDLATLLAPFDEQRFWDEHFATRPLHVPHAAGGLDKAGLMSLARLSELLGEPARWAQNAVKLLINGRGVDPAHFTVSREFAQGNLARPDPALIETLVAVGASLVIDGMEDQSADLRQMCRVLGESFGAKATVNLYASRRGVQAFSSHCDPHEVFAIHCEGEKVWRIYEGVEEAPVEATVQRDADYIERKKGRVVMEVTMRPGDLLYIPRGHYHDALASSERTLHLTFGVQPLYSIAVLDLLREMEFDDRVMREYLPPARNAAAWQRQLSVVEQPLTGSVLVIGNHRLPAGLISDAARWAFAQPSFSWPQLAARFCHHPAAELEAFLAEALARGAFERRPMA